MKIEYNENPITTKVYLSEAEKRLLFWSYTYSRLDDRIWHLKSSIEPLVNGEGYNLVKIENNQYLKDLVASPLTKSYDCLEKICEEATVEQYNESMIRSFVDALQDSHDGDCIKQPASCLKCWSEDILGINTLENCSSPSSVFWAYSNPEVNTIDEAISYLEGQNYSHNKWEGFDSYKTEWIQKNLAAADYLKWYKIERMNKTVILS